MGRVKGHRGARGELTVKVPGGDAGWWNEVEEIWIGEDRARARPVTVESSRSYRDRLVLKLAGVDDPAEAEALRGRGVWVARERAPVLPPGRHYLADLVGLEVVDEAHGRLGRVQDVIPTGGTDLLVVRATMDDGDDGDRNEVLVPVADGIVLDVDRGAGRIRVRVPEGLVELNRVKP